MPLSAPVMPIEDDWMDEEDMKTDLRELVE